MLSGTSCGTRLAGISNELNELRTNRKNQSRSLVPKVLPEVGLRHNGAGLGTHVHGR
jgi:hypothetical protein